MNLIFTPFDRVTENVVAQAEKTSLEGYIYFWQDTILLQELLNKVLQN